MFFPQFAQTTAKPDGKRYCHFPMLAAIVGLTVRFIEQRKGQVTQELVDENAFTFNTDIPPNRSMEVSREIDL